MLGPARSGPTSNCVKLTQIERGEYHRRLRRLLRAVSSKERRRMPAEAASIEGFLRRTPAGRVSRARRAARKRGRRRCRYADRRKTGDLGGPVHGKRRGHSFPSSRARRGNDSADGHSHRRQTNPFSRSIWTSSRKISPSASCA